jgi:hypothetical protein
MLVICGMLTEGAHLQDLNVDWRMMKLVLKNTGFVKPILFASFTCAFSKWCKSKKGVKRSAQ